MGLLVNSQIALLSKMGEDTLQADPVITFLTLIIGRVGRNRPINDLDVGGPTRIPQSVDRLFDLGQVGTHARDHQVMRPAREVILQDPSQLRVTIRHMGLLLRQPLDAIAQSQ